MEAIATIIVGVESEKKEATVGIVCSERVVYMTTRRGTGISATQKRHRRNGERDKSRRRDGMGTLLVPSIDPGDIQ